MYMNISSTVFPMYNSIYVLVNIFFLFRSIEEAVSTFISVKEYDLDKLYCPFKV